MKSLKMALAGMLLLVSLPLMAQSDANPLASLHWQVGPTTGTIGDKGTIAVPKGYVFLGKEDTAKFMTLTENLSSGEEYILAPDDLGWFAIFQFEATGYVKDDEKIDADDLLESVKDNTERANEERRKKGWSTMSITGWRFPPRYDNGTHLLEWAFLGKDDENGSAVVNYNTRILGRTGVMGVVVVADPGTVGAAVGQFKAALKGYEFDDGERYAQYQPGDKVAEYGLAALIAGGAAAVAAKKGFFSIILGALAAGWKIVLAALAGVGAWLRSRFRSKA